MGFKEFGSLSFHDSGAGHVKQFFSTPLVLPPTYYNHISFILATRWNVECAHELR